MKKFIIGWVKFRHEKRAEFLAAVQILVAATRQEEGRVFFEVTLSLDKPDTALSVECFKSADAHEEHQNTPHMKAFMARMADILVEGRFENILSDTIVSDGL